MRSIVKSIYEHSFETPNKKAIIGLDDTVDFATLWRLIANASHYLKKAGVKRGDRVIVEADHTVEYLVCCYGTHLSGGVFVPVENGIPESRVNEIAKELQAKVFLLGKHPLNGLHLDYDALKDQYFDDFTFPEESWLQEILYTTGTTGKSKGVMVTHYAQMNMCQSQNAVINFSIDNMWLIPSPMNHAAGLRKVHMSMVRGSSVLLINGFKDLRKFFQNLREYGVTSLYLPPAGVHYILALAGKELAKFDGQLDFIYSSSSALPGGDKEKLIQLLPHVRKFDAYGGSEVGAVVYIDYNAIRGDGTCVGKPNPGVDVFIVDENYQPMQATKDNPGIIAIRSNTVTAGYWNEPELTAETIQNGVIYMSDLGYINEEGFLFLVGRRDDVINIGGFKVAPTEVEDVALRYPTVQECVCIPYKDAKLGTCIKLCVCLKAGNILDIVDLTSFMEEKLEFYKVPKFIEQVDHIPKTYNGKIDRKKIIQQALI